MHRRSGVLLLVAAAVVSAACGPPRGRHDERLRSYLYEDTRQLVAFVEEAAGLLEARGREAFRDFAPTGRLERPEGLYLFVYDAKGTNLWHGANAALVGRSLWEFRDLDGKYVLKEMAEIALRPERDASGWVFYLWEEKSEFLPRWKASYLRKAVGPDGTIFLVGSGSSRLKVEKTWVRARVDEAAELLGREGAETASRTFRDPASRFQFMETYIFVVDGKGRALVDAAYPTLGGRDLSAFRDAVGKPVLKEAFAKLRSSDAAWLQYLWPRPGEALPSRKALYMRKVTAGGETLFVGSDFFLATPVWMRL